MIVTKSQILNFLIFLFAIFIGLINFGSATNLICFFITYFYISWIIVQNSSIHMMFFLGYTTFIALPALLNWYYLDTSFELFFLTSFCALPFILVTKDTEFRYFINYGKRPKIAFIGFSIVVILFLVLDYQSVASGMFAFLILLMSLSFQQGKFLNNSICLVIYLVVFFVYAIFYWSGFGRSVVVGWLLLAILQFAYSMDFKINKLIFGIVPGLSATLLSSRDLLDLKFNGFESSLNGSAYNPYQLASTFIDSFNLYGYDVQGFIDQILFTAFIFIPRTLWPSKPYGFGYEFTVRHYEQYLVDAGHSIAATLIGEHIYFLGYLGMLSAITTLLVIGWLTNILYRLKGYNGNAILIFSASMMILTWGGMTSFSARVALPLIIFLLLNLLLRKYLTGK